MEKELHVQCVFSNKIHSIQQSLKEQLATSDHHQAEPLSTPTPPASYIGQDITILTRVEEKSTLDVSRILADLDDKCAELAILQQVLVLKEQEAKVGAFCSFVPFLYKQFFVS